MPCAGLLDPRSAGKFDYDMIFDKEEGRPTILQLFGSCPDQFRKCAALAVQLGFHGVDINMGCPERSVTLKQHSGAALINNPLLAKAIIKAVREGLDGEPLGVSVKTRIGDTTDMVDTWIPHLLDGEPDLITVHGRTRAQLSVGPASWTAIERAANIIKSSGSETLCFGNGDVVSMSDAYSKCQGTNIDGCMVGRGLFGNPWFGSGVDISAVPHVDILKVALEHSRTWEELFYVNGEYKKSYANMRRNYAAYFDGSRFKQLRVDLGATKNIGDAMKILEHEILTKSEQEREDTLTAMQA